jgi:glycosyltransferase involved in cell wall biosynthesis
MLAEKVLEIIQNPALQKSMSAKSLEIIGTHDIRRTVDRFEELYQEVIARHSASAPAA